jgi:hypothetical protein
VRREHRQTQQNEHHPKCFHHISRDGEYLAE